MALAAVASPQNRRAIGIVRVSQVGGRKGERFVSPEEQRDRIQAACERDGLELVEIHEEMDVSGGKSLADRPGLRAAVSAIENGDADVVAAAYFDRLFRSLQTQAEVIDRIEAAGGRVLAVDIGHVTSASAGQWLSGTMMGAVSEYFRRSAKERSAEGQARAVARGAVPWSRTPLGYLRRNDATLEPDPETAPIVRRVFELRADGVSHMDLRAMLKEHGVERSHRGVQVMLSSRTYLGELHFGQHVNREAHEAIVDRALWERVQRMVVPRGRHSDSDRLLARLGVLRCGSCGARMSAMKLPKQGDYPIYRCPSTSDCERHMTISAVIAEDVVVKAVKVALRDMQGRADAAEGARSDAGALARVQGDIDAAVRILAATGLGNEPAAIARLAELSAERDALQARVDLRTPTIVESVRVDEFDSYAPARKREIIRAVVISAVVGPGRGAGRMEVETFI